MTPATAFTKAVCERASKDGWQLELDAFGAIWRLRGKKTLHADFPAPSLDARHALWQACFDLQQREYPDLQSVTIG